jgi:hypothetical protein
MPDKATVAGDPGASVKIVIVPAIDPSAVGTNSALSVHAAAGATGLEELQVPMPPDSNPAERVTDCVK